MRGVRLPWPLPCTVFVRLAGRHRLGASEGSRFFYGNGEVLGVGAKNVRRRRCPRVRASSFFLETMEYVFMAVAQVRPTGLVPYVS